MGLAVELERNFGDEIVGEFIGHFGVMCDVMVPHINALRAGNDIGHNMDELFRIFHNIKSALAYLQLDKISKLAALGEEYLDEVRVDKRVISDQLARWLTIVADQMSDWQDDLENDHPYLSRTRREIIRLPRIIFDA